MRVVLMLVAVMIGLAVPGGAIAKTRANQPVGVVSFEIADPERRDPIATDLGRAWRVDLYYPAADGGTARPYLADPALLTTLIADGYYDVPEATLRGWAAQPGPALVAAPPAETSEPLPLVTISPGSGVAAFNYGELAAALARRGYAVAVIDLPYIGPSRLADGRVMRPGDDPLQQSDDIAALTPRVREWSRDVSVTLDRLFAADRPSAIPASLALDPRRVTVTGHSLGGTVAVQVCNDDPRIEACADFEGAPDPTTIVDQGPVKPTLITGARSAKPDRPFEKPDLSSPFWSFLGRGENASNWAIAITKGSHMSYSDAPYEMPETLSRFGGTLMTPERSFELYTGLVDAFARAYAPGCGGNAAFADFLHAQPEIKATSSAEARDGAAR